MAMPIQTSGPGVIEAVTMPVIAADIGATPVSSPARAAPRAATDEYQSTNAAAVTNRARYAIAA
jgi:hypothetical protein